MARAINIKLGIHILCSRPSHLVHTDPEDKGSRSNDHENRQGRTVASDACCYSRVLLLPAWVCLSIQLPMFS